MRVRKGVQLVCATVLSLSACGDPVTTTTARLPGDVAFAIGPVDDPTPVAGQAKVCKTGNVDGVFDVTLVGGLGTVSGVGTAVPVGTCYIVAEPDPMFSGTTIRVTENPATYLTGITCEASDGTPCTLVNGSTPFVTPTRGLTFTFNNFREPSVVPLFVVGDAAAHAIGDSVYFWGAQWWQHNPMSGAVSSGVASFIGYASEADVACGGTWLSRVGSSASPPATIPDVIAVVVTSGVQKKGPILSGDIQEIVMVTQDGGYGPAPGKDGRGVVVASVCPAP